MTAARPQRLFTVDEYDRMIETGILCEGERVELLEGLIFHMAAMGPTHNAQVSRLDRWFQHHLPSTADVRVQSSIRLPPRAEPEPDAVIVRHREDDYEFALPGPSDILLVIEVADSSLAHDRDVKFRLYASSGIPEAWLFDVGGRRVSVCRTPQDGVYQDITVLEPGGILTPLAFPELHLPVNEILR